MRLMRTTLDIDDDVLEAAKEISRRTKRTAGKVVSDLARQALVSSHAQVHAGHEVVNGFEIMPASGRVVTAELVKALMEESEVA
ncbi:MAG: antitoxin [Verrucomicrobiota bacterium]|nr:antitoxin [Verrucomicrobiota bacterium]